MSVPMIGEEEWELLRQEAPLATRALEVAWRLERIAILATRTHTEYSVTNMREHEAALIDIGYSILVNAMIHVGKDMERPGRAHSIRILASHIGRLAIEEGLYLQYAKGR